MVEFLERSPENVESFHKCNKSVITREASLRSTNAICGWRKLKSRKYLGNTNTAQFLLGTRHSLRKHSGENEIICQTALQARHCKIVSQNHSHMMVTEIFWAPLNLALHFNFWIHISCLNLWKALIAQASNFLITMLRITAIASMLSLH